MGRQEKLRERFLSCPKDFTWMEMVRFLKSFGYVEHKGSGSHRVFKGEGLPRLYLAEPHPENTVKRVYLKQVREVLEGEGLI